MSAFSEAGPDITLHLDDQGVIREAVSSSGVSGEGVEGWVGRAWLDTVSDDGGDQVRRMMDAARKSGVSAFGKVMQRFPSGRELPFEYTTIRVGGVGGGLLVLGRNLQFIAELQQRLSAAQSAMEREYWKSRDVETRYRLLFDTSDKAVVMVRGEDYLVMEANPAAVRALGFFPGWTFTTGLAAADLEAFEAMLRRVREHGRSPGLVVHMGLDRVPVAVRASVVQGESSLCYLLHVAPVGGRAEPKLVQLANAAASGESAMDDLVERLPDGFAVVGADGTIQRVNRAFLDQLGVVSRGSVIGQPLGRWLSHPGADAAVMLALLRRHGAVAAVETRMYGELGRETPVEISGAASADDNPRFALVSRDIGRRAEAAGAPDLVGSATAELLESSARQLGHSTLLQIVKQTADAVEAHVIEVALGRVNGNRTAAAELLGLSRQSLHAKLNRHGGDHAAGESARPAEAADGSGRVLARTG